MRQARLKPDYRDTWHHCYNRVAGGSLHKFPVPSSSPSSPSPVPASPVPVPTSQVGAGEEGKLGRGDSRLLYHQRSSRTHHDCIAASGQRD
jgi:hypothetical protein